MEYKSFYSTVESGEGFRCNYPTRLDTYGCGCSHNCAYCYARAILEFRGNWHPEEPHVASIDKIRAKLDEVPAGAVLRLGGMTDCFQACEKENKVTLETIKELNKRGIHYLIVTKSDLVAEYADVMRKDLAHIQVSITSTSDKTNALKELAPAPSRRMRAVKSLSKAGFDVQIRLSPYLPEYVDLKLLKRKTGCERVLVEFLRVNGNIKKLLDIDFSPYTLKLGGYRHLPLKVKKKYLQPILETFSEVSVCEDVYSHWNVWQQTVNANSNDCCNLKGVK